MPHEMTPADIARDRATIAAASPESTWEVGGPYPSVSVIVCIDPGCGGPDAEPPTYDCIAQLHQSHDYKTPPPAEAVALAAFIVAAHERWPLYVDAAEAGQKFKAFVHRYLSEHGVPEGDPENEHQKAGCRIGARLDLLFAELDRAVLELKTANGHWPEIERLQAELEAALAEVERLKELCEQIRQWCPDCAQLLDGWHADGTAWSKWDESVRQRLSVLQAMLEEGKTNVPGIRGRT